MSSDKRRYNNQNQADPKALLLDLTLNFDESKKGWVEQVFGCSIETKSDHDAAIHRFLLDLGDEARDLRDILT